ncbi:MAG: radical SAM protein [Dehalococcoidia bacterium]|nr:radical SAM protein [Dehalococcoidia bacterium]
MISISRLLCDTVGPGDYLRYRTPVVKNKHKDDSGAPKPVVVWNCTRHCNLACIHCYASAVNRKKADEMDTSQGKRMLADLAEFGVPVILFSGGEPLLREDIFELAEYAVKQNIRVSLSTNGTLISSKAAGLIRDVGFAEVGISLDGIDAVNDRFRGKDQAFNQALQGIRNCIALGIRVSLRLTITNYNYEEIPAIFDLVENEGIDRVCFYHLAYSGRGKGLRQFDVTHAQTRQILEIISERTIDLHKRGLPKEILTVGNHADGVFIYLRMLKQDPSRAEKIIGLLELNGGNNSGIRIGAIDEMGYVHPDQFWQHYSLGNAVNRKFSEIWMDSSEPLMNKLRNRKKWLKGRCAQCKYLNICNGNLRIRAEAAYGDIWQEDPACYLTYEEIGS